MAFRATLFRTQGKGGWHFAPVPDAEAPFEPGPWGRAPVRATVDGITWDTSVWFDSRRGVLLAVRKRVRRGKGDGDEVTVELAGREG